ncbi:phenylalanine--tRNA ligase subunit beta [Vibrio mimicus]
MKFSESWLREWVNLPTTISSEELAYQITMAGLEVDGINLVENSDVIIDVDLTANRADCLSIAGLAREVGVLNKTNVIEPTYKSVLSLIDDTIDIDVQAVNACPRYLGRIIRNADIPVDTPFWIKKKLGHCGISSINPVMDITNYVMLEIGQPMHIFDLDKIKGSLIIRMARQGEIITLQDDTEIALNNDTLIITDKKEPLAIAGIIGGKSSAVTDKTKNIFLECAFFSPEVIRGRARSYRLHTESSHRFERGVDTSIQKKAMERVSALLVDVCGGEISPMMIIENEQYIPKKSAIVLRRLRLDRLLGHVILSEDVNQILLRLGCGVESFEAGWKVTPPTWRFDIAIEEDLIEEIGRIFGYSNIPSLPPMSDIRTDIIGESELTLNRVCDLLIDRGYYEAITYSFVDPVKQKLMVPYLKPLVLPHPISLELSAMRLSLWTGLINTVVSNQKRQQQRVRLFESGLRFIPDGTAENGIRQEMMIAGVISGSKSDESWDVKSRTVVFFDMKEDVEAILELTGNQNKYSFEATIHPSLHPGQTAAIFVDGKEVGLIGTIHPELELKLGLNGETIVFEIEWDAINKRSIPEAKTISKYPANRRDIAVVVPENIPSNKVIELCNRVGGESITDINIFDVYQGNNIENGFKSLAIALTLQSVKSTLNESQINSVINSIVSALSCELGATLRE